MRNTLILLFMIGAGLYTLNNLSHSISASSTCYSNDSGGVNLGLFGLHKSSISDDACKQMEAARMTAELGMPEHAKVIVCSHPGARISFGSKKDCLEFRGGYKEIVMKTNNTESYCHFRSKKWYRKLTFTSKRSYKNCIRERT